jgi:hypothetical protein
MKHDWGRTKCFMGSADKAKRGLQSICPPLQGRSMQLIAANTSSQRGREA